MIDSQAAVILNNLSDPSSIQEHTNYTANKMQQWYFRLPKFEERLNIIRGGLALVIKDSRYDVFKNAFIKAFCVANKIPVTNEMSFMQDVNPHRINNFLDKLICTLQNDSCFDPRLYTTFASTWPSFSQNRYLKNRIQIMTDNQEIERKISEEFQSELQRIAVKTNPKNNPEFDHRKWLQAFNKHFNVS